MERKKPDRMKGVTRWFSQFPGTVLLEQERALVDPLLSRLFGYYLVQLGSIGGQPSESAANHIRYRVTVAPELSEITGPGCIGGHPEKLPLASDSVDVVLLAHTLDFYPNPHQTLREVDRILIPEGRLVIIGFNPLSLWGLWRLLRWHSSSAPWGGRFISLHRMCDWLFLLGFEVEERLPVMFKPPLRQRSLMDRMQLLERAGRRWWPALSGVYVIRAVKRVSTITPVKPAWKLRRSLLAGRAIEPSTRSSRG